MKQKLKSFWLNSNLWTAILCVAALLLIVIPMTYISKYMWPVSDDFEEPTQLDNIEATQLTIMIAMAEQYEESLERELVNMEVQATIYEAILEMGGAV